MCLDSIVMGQSISEDEERFPIATIHDFSRNMEPLGFEDVQPSLGSLEPPNAPTFMDACCYGHANCGFAEDAVDNEVYGKYELSTPERFDEKLQSLSLCMDCNKNQVQVMVAPCKHLTLCEPCADYAIICPICSEVIDRAVKSCQKTHPCNLYRQHRLHG